MLTKGISERRQGKVAQNPSNRTMRENVYPPPDMPSPQATARSPDGPGDRDNSSLRKLPKVS